jgi:type IV secretory pathway VirB10-like protein
VQNPVRFQLRAGFVIPAVLLSGVNSEVPGSIIAQVAQDVYDNATGTDLLMPQGARLIGSYSANVQYGVLVQIVLSVLFFVWREDFADSKRTGQRPKCPERWLLFQLAV